MCSWSGLRLLNILNEFCDCNKLAFPSFPVYHVLSVGDLKQWDRLELEYHSGEITFQVCTTTLLTLASYPGPPPQKLVFVGGGGGQRGTGYNAILPLFFFVMLLGVYTLGARFTSDHSLFLCFCMHIHVSLGDDLISSKPSLISLLILLEPF